MPATVERGWDPGASKPGNKENHVGPLRKISVSEVQEHTRLPDWFVEDLEAHQDEWNLTAAGFMCKNCGTGFLGITVWKPVRLPMPSILGQIFGPIVALEPTNYCFEADQ